MSGHPPAAPRNERAMVNENMALALEATGGHVVRAARLLGIAEKTLYLRIAAGRVQRPEMTKGGEASHAQERIEEAVSADAGAPGQGNADAHAGGQAAEEEVARDSG